MLESDASSVLGIPLEHTILFGKSRRTVLYWYFMVVRIVCASEFARVCPVCVPATMYPPVIRRDLLKSMFLMAATVVRRKELLIPLSRLRRALSPAPSASWDPSRKTLSSADIDLSTATVGVTVHLPEGTVLQIKAPVNNTLMQALEAADLGDVWPGGACGGMCSCSTCRVVINHAPRPFPPRSEDEEDMLDVAASATARQRNDESVMDGFLAESSRLGCQLTLTEQDHGLIIALPDDVTNVLEVPLWLRGSR